MILLVSFLGDIWKLLLLILNVSDKYIFSMFITFSNVLIIPNFTLGILDVAFRHIFHVVNVWPGLDWSDLKKK